MSKAIVIEGLFEDRQGYEEYGRVRKVIYEPEYGCFEEFTDAIAEIQGYEDLSTDAPFSDCEACCIAITSIKIIDIPHHITECYWWWMGNETRGSIG